VVLKVRSLDDDVDVEAVGGAFVSIDVAREFAVGKLMGVASSEGVANGDTVLPMDFMICADLVGSNSVS